MEELPFIFKPDTISDGTKAYLHNVHVQLVNALILSSHRILHVLY